MASAAQGVRVRDELMRQLLLERRHAVLLTPAADGGVKVPKSVARALAGFEFRAITQPALEPLCKLAGRVLVRADGLVFNVALISVVEDEGGFCQRVPLDELVEIGASLTSHTGSVSGSRLPVTFQIFEIFARGISDDFVAHAAEYKRRGVAAPKVGIGVVAIDAQSGRTWSNYPGLVRWTHVGLLRRAWRERELDPDARAALLARSGFQLDKALLGAGAGGATGSALTWALVAAGSTRGAFYGAAVLLGALIGAAVSLKACRVVHATLVQAGVAGGAAALIGIGVGNALGLGLGFGTVVTLLMAVGVSVMIGAADNPRGERS
jgi:hypothetical protein